jgi:hypothetical protein
VQVARAAPDRLVLLVAQVARAQLAQPVLLVVLVPRALPARPVQQEVEVVAALFKIMSILQPRQSLYLLVLLKQ